jgi:hypothetical protein
MIRALGLVDLRYAFQTGHHKRFSFLLDLARFGKCGDPRDKVYAVLGLADQRVKKSIQVDYSKPVSWLYAKIVNVAHALDGNMEIISLSEPDPETILPSWCPDWSREPRVSPSKSRYLAPKKQYTSSAIFSKDLRSLYIDGFSVDVIAETKPEETKSILQDISEEQDWSRNVSNMARVLNVSEKVRASDERVAGNSTKFGQSSIATVLYNISEIINETQTSSRSTVELNVANSEGLAFSNNGQGSQMERSVDKRYLFGARFYMENRAIIVSNTRYFGLAPGTTRPGDHIFHLFEVGFPAILRPNLDRSWTYIGQAFILSLMRGEAIVDYERGIYKKQQLELR